MKTAKPLTGRLVQSKPNPQNIRHDSPEARRIIKAFVKIFVEPDDEPKPKRSQRCVCGTDMPGVCPGRDNCPYSGDDDD